MRAVLFGATGMVGQCVLRECLEDADVELVAAIGRSGTGVQNAKLREILHADLLDYTAIESQLRGFDACFFCLGVSSVGMKPEEYERITYGFTMAAARTLSRLNPQMTFVYVSGAGTDSSERGRTAWARVKGRTENELLRLPFKAAYMFRPGIIQPLEGIRSKTASVRVFYLLLSPVMPLFRRIAPNIIVTSQQLGRAMVAAAKRGAPKRILEVRDIRELAAGLS
jgi:uncharacterized protein YbjT (DUF2867 family)